MIPFFDYRPEYLRLRDEIDGAVRRVLDSGRLILGPEVEAFEREFATWTGAGSAVGVASGTDAVALALRALEIGPGDEVITVANSGVPPVAAIRLAGATPRFVDVDPENLLLDPAALDAARTPWSRAILPIHLYGRPLDLEPILAYAREHGLAVVEDCAHGHGARLNGRHVGTRGEIGCFSFYPTKTLGAYGDGGICITADLELARRLRRLRMYGLEKDHRSRVEGVNSRLDELQAAILRVKLARLDATVAERRRLAGLYLELLGDSGFALPADPPGGEHAYHLFVARTPERGALIARLEAAGLGYGLHYPEPVHRMEAYRPLGYGAGSLPVTERSCGEVLSLPLYPGLADEAVRRVARTLLGSP